MKYQIMCIGIVLIKNSFYRTGSLYNDIVTIDLGYVCSSAVNTGTEENNKVC
jgi:hypothetical protein